MKKATKLLVSAMVIALTAVSVFAFAACKKKTDEKLYVYNWGDYWDPEIEAEFEAWYEEQTGTSIDLVYSMFETNEEMLTNVTNGSESIDLICPSDYAIERLKNNNQLKAIDKSLVPDEINYFGNVNTAIYDRSEEISADLKDYFVPYMIGTIGILYNTAYVTEEQVAEAGFGIFWNKTNIAGINKKIFLKDSIRDTYVAAVMYLKEEGRLPQGFENKSVSELINSTDIALVAAVEKVLKEQKAYLKGYEVDFGKDDILAGNALVDLAWAGDALYVMDEADEGAFGYYIPDSGSNFFFDGWVIPKSCQNEKAATYFLSFLCRKDIATRNMVYIGYTSAVDPALLAEDEDVIAILNENGWETDEDIADFFADENRYPDMTDENLALMHDFGSKEKVVEEMWERVKAA
ncbi:MAG: extracellular solute-binding protein [Christensenellaceae bacterium]|jgi:spermidine/putrescine transport system substrate-binding protein|nr:extracellular solute-binding protein [Christensenellaceae bacterium]